MTLITVKHSLLPVDFAMLEDMRILNLVTYPIISAYSGPSAIIGEWMRQLGHDVVELSCGGFGVAACPALEYRYGSSDVSEKARKQICNECRGMSHAIGHTKDVALIRIDEYIEPDDYDACRLKAKLLVAKTRNSVTHEELKLISHASYEILLRLKFQGEEIPENHKQSLENAIYVCLLAETGTKRLLEKYPSFDRVIVNNSLRGLNRTILNCVIQSGAQPVFVNAGSNIAHQLSQIMIFNTEEASLDWANSPGWQAYKLSDAQIPRLQQIKEHFVSLFEAKSNFVYSDQSRSMSSEVIYKRLHLSHDKTTFLALMASNDERVAAESVGALEFFRDRKYLFKNQIAWLKFLVEEFRSRPDIQLIIRVHPREFPNKRESVLSEHARDLLKELDDLPSNVHVNWPTDEISLYDLVQVVDVGLVASSSTGLQLATLGIPIGIHNSSLLTGYTRELGTDLGSTKEYRAFLDSALNHRWSVENVIAGLKWHSYMFNCLSVDILSTSNEQGRTSNHSHLFTQLQLSIRRLLPSRFKKLIWSRRTLRLLVDRIETRILQATLKNISPDYLTCSRLKALLDNRSIDLAATELIPSLISNSGSSTDSAREFLQLVSLLLPGEIGLGLLSGKIASYLNC